jgi:GxxExxY protein
MPSEKSNDRIVMDINKLSSRIIGAAIEVHKALGPGLLESAYEECICHELSIGGLSLERQKPLNFNVILMRDGIVRIVNKLEE